MLAMPAPLHFIPLQHLFGDHMGNRYFFPVLMFYNGKDLHGWKKIELNEWFKKACAAVNKEAPAALFSPDTVYVI